MCLHRTRVARIIGDENSGWRREQTLPHDTEKEATKTLSFRWSVYPWVILNYHRASEAQTRKEVSQQPCSFTRVCVFAHPKDNTHLLCCSYYMFALFLPPFLLLFVLFQGGIYTEFVSEKMVFSFSGRQDQPVSCCMSSGDLNGKSSTKKCYA